jgi:predicted transposase YbfD/YdcC
MLSSDSSPAPVPESLLAQLAQLPDPRVERTKQHQLTDILAIALLAELCGADSFTEMAQFGRAREPWLRTFLALPNGIPSHDTFTRVFARLNPDAFAACLAEWAQAVAALALEESRPQEGAEAESEAKVAESEAEIVAIDGKTARRSYDTRSAQAPLHTVSAWATEHHLVLGQVKTEAHSNEITAIPELLALLDLRGATVTIDAMGCQKSITTAIRAKGAHYVLALKSNQPWLHQRVAAFHAAATAEPQRYWRGAVHETYSTVEKDHGRIEKRRYTVVDATAVLRERSGWQDLASVGWVESERRLLCGPRKGTTTREVRYFISSLPPQAVALAHAVRSHWGIENRCHWTLDVVFQEDQSRVRKDHGPANLATLRRWVLSLLRQDTTHKHGLKARRLQAAWDQDYLLRLLRFTSPVPAKN